MQCVKNKEDTKNLYLGMCKNLLNYDSNSLGLTDILEMDIIHFIRAFKLLNKKTTDYNLNAVRPSKVALNLIAGKLHIAVNELEEYINNE